MSFSLFLNVIQLPSIFGVLFIVIGFVLDIKLSVKKHHSSNLTNAEAERLQFHCKIANTCIALGQFLVALGLLWTEITSPSVLFLFSFGIILINVFNAFVYIDKIFTEAPVEMEKNLNSDLELNKFLTRAGVLNV